MTNTVSTIAPRRPVRWLFRISCAINAFAAAIVVYFFVVGVGDGSVSSFNIGIWIALLAVVSTVVGGSLWLHSIGRRRLALALAAAMAVPALLMGLFFLLLILSGPRWN